MPKRPKSRRSSTPNIIEAATRRLALSPDENNQPDRARQIRRRRPLRERQADVEWLAEDLLAAIAPSRRLTQQAKAALTAHGWPGNVRELKNTLERTVALSGVAGPVQVQDLRLPNAALPAPAPADNGRLSFPDAVQALARRALVEGVVPKPDEQSAKRGRAQQRAALLYLRLQASTEPWPPERTRQFQRLFGSQWATSEGGRGLAELMVTLGLNPNDANDRAELHDWLQRAGIAV